MPIPARLLAGSSALSALAILATQLVPARVRRAHRPGVTRRAVDELRADLYLPLRLPAPGIVLVMGTLREGSWLESSVLFSQPVIRPFGVQIWRGWMVSGFRT